ncbi:hypothetical protein Sked_20110 [Sanguibacter keddieii DSM 10542]|uniref:Acyl-CoA dehydrogenase n=1 Tax=Sanguibacter keddieii (strain ATCC 51767 / DSM 10542 / NCFB 3025 / ST-74) TaxID=446469 RepID=D1BHL5_SANKS|nr:acyl-CoA dehydrogenase family protein [Sanguibacter keddieii]ACZ21935.1 hypothetical protein Sked_20110 [Sanguibacter keddieii DSM 10542]
MDQATTTTAEGGLRARLGQPEGIYATTAVDALLAEVPQLGTDVTASISWAVRLGPHVPVPGQGQTLDAWETLASTAALDVGVARVLEPHLDALSILAQAPAGTDLSSLGVDDGSSWGVFAAEGPGARLEASVSATATSSSSDDDWVLDGVKPWCSLAANLSHALVTAWTPTGRRLFAVRLQADGVEAATGPWVSRGLQQVVSAPVTFSSVPAVPVGDVGWYLTRPGFAWGGIGVAAAWWGGAVGVARDLYAALGEREPDQLALAHLGAVDTALTAARATLLDAASVVDAGAAETGGAPGDDAPRPGVPAPSVVARRARGVVARAVEEVLTRSTHARGPGPLTSDETHARRVADLAVYVRQHHAERDDASLGKALLEAGDRPW